MSAWPSLPVDDLCIAIVDCVNRTAPTVDEATPYRMIRTTNVRNGFVDTLDTKSVDEETFRIWTRRQLPRAGDVILTREAPLGEVGILRGDDKVFLGQRLVSYRTDPELLDNRFLMYYLLSAEGRAQVLAFGSGSTVAHMRVPDAKRLMIPTPPIETQRQIAGILGAYDDLIEVNRRRVAVLEDMARGLFEEWFMRLRAPGSDMTPFCDAADAPLPVGWHWGTAADVVDFDPKTKVAKEGRKPFVSMGHLDTATSLIDEPEMREGNSGAKFQEGDTLFARITPCLENGKTGLVRGLSGLGGVGFGSTEFIVMRGGRAGPAFTYCLARTSSFRLAAQQSMSGASGRQRAKTESVASFPLALPADDDLFEAFERAAWPLLELVGKLGAANQRLAAARDLLLPRLMSGQLSVSEAEVEAEAQKELEIA